MITVNLYRPRYRSAIKAWLASHKMQRILCLMGEHDWEGFYLRRLNDLGYAGPPMVGRVCRKCRIGDYA